ncbi:hypothetical protein AgCh_026811 [Apium graveolens]
MGRNRSNAFKPLIGRVEQRLQGWANKSLSKGGKVVLLKTSAQSIPNFLMNLLLVPAEVCEEIQKKMNGFWWGNGESGKGIRWMAWERMCVTKEAGGLGFRELRKFNIAMLAKQGWRLLNNENPLVTSLIKARYYPNSDFLNAKLGSNPSYMWRSIIDAQDAVKQGCRRKIGDGQSTRVWMVPWLPCIENGTPTTVMPQELENITVSGLMREGVNQWDDEILRDIFNERDVNLIRQIPLPRTTEQDSWFWMVDDKGLFSVRSCYRLLQGESINADSVFWKKLWSIRPVWEDTGVESLIQVLPHDTVFDVLKRVFENGSREQIALIGLFCWSIWNRRNKWVWDRNNISVFGVKSAAISLLDDWKKARQEDHNHSSVRNIATRTWNKPPPGWVKINIDAAIFLHISCSGLGSVIRDDTGRFLRARNKRVEAVLHPREAESLSLKEALSWAKDLGFQKCSFETDAKLLVNACKGEHGRSYFHTIVKDCVNYFKHFDQVLVDFVSRSANDVVHVLARATHSMSGSHEWVNTPLAFISDVIILDSI